MLRSPWDLAVGLNSPEFCCLGAPFTLARRIPSPIAAAFHPRPPPPLVRLLLDRFKLANPRHLVGHRLAARLGPLGVGVGQRGGGQG